LQRFVGARVLFPDDRELEWRARREPKRLPGLSWLLATIAPIAGSVERAGLYLIPVLANLFLIPMFIYGWRIGYPAAGLMGGLVATFSIGYYARSSIGWVDTDCLNLLFPWAASLLVLCIRRDQCAATVLLLSATLGVTLYLSTQVTSI
jgi:dolichyl-diphosphooligosaccharide--protein glycosyltransferase